MSDTQPTTTQPKTQYILHAIKQSAKTCIMSRKVKIETGKNTGKMKVHNLYATAEFTIRRPKTIAEALQFYAKGVVEYIFFERSDTRVSDHVRRDMLDTQDLPDFGEDAVAAEAWITANQSKLNARAQQLVDGKIQGMDGYPACLPNGTQTASGGVKKITVNQARLTALTMLANMDKKRFPVDMPNREETYYAKMPVDIKADFDAAYPPA